MYKRPGLVYCSDCGQYLVLCRTEKMREDQYYFRCSTYGKRGKDACTPHQIREADLKQIVLCLLYTSRCV